jgi:hypothetical protein
MRFRLLGVVLCCGLRFFIPRKPKKDRHEVNNLKSSELIKDFSGTP